MSKRKEKIDVSVSGASPLLVNPFAALELSGLPPGPETVEAPLPEEKPAGKRGRVVLRRETAGRGGKTVVVVSDFDPLFSEADLDGFLGGLKKACGTGGTRRGRELEIQGDLPAKVAAYFEKEGFRVAGVKA
jgi:translation initiation factor 1